MAERKKKKLKNMADKKNAIKIIPMTDEETEEEEKDEQDEEAGGMYLEKEDVLLLYNALKNYKPTGDDEEMTHEMLVEQFEEILIVDYKVKLPGVRW